MTRNSSGFQYRKRYEVTCDIRGGQHERRSFKRFQYRKRYEVTCDIVNGIAHHRRTRFQYRKRYEVTCDKFMNEYDEEFFGVSIPQAV